MENGAHSFGLREIEGPAMILINKPNKPVVALVHRTTQLGEPTTSAGHARGRARCWKEGSQFAARKAVVVFGFACGREFSLSLRGSMG